MPLQDRPKRNLHDELARTKFSKARPGRNVLASGRAPYCAAYGAATRPMKSNLSPRPVRCEASQCACSPVCRAPCARHDGDRRSRAPPTSSPKPHYLNRSDQDRN